MIQRHIPKWQNNLVPEEECDGGLEAKCRLCAFVVNLTAGSKQAVGEWLLRTDVNSILAYKRRQSFLPVKELSSRDSLFVSLALSPDMGLTAHTDDPGDTAEGGQDLG